MQDAKDEVLIYDLKANKAFCLNETSKLVWEQCNGKLTVAEIADEISQRSKKLVSEDIVYLAIEQFNKDGLLENDTSDEFKTHFGGLSRREVIRKVGFASMIALPIVSSIVAPSAANAASGQANNTACTANGDCQSGNCQTGICCASGTISNVQPGIIAGCADPACADVYTCCSGSASPGTEVPFCRNLGATTCYCN